MGIEPTYKGFADLCGFSILLTRLACTPFPTSPFYPLFGAFLAQNLLKFLGNSAEALRSKAQSDGSYFATVTVPLPNFPV